MFKNKNSAFILLSLCLFLVQCSKDSASPANNQNGYGGSASYGDLLSFDFNESNNTYSITNETTNQTTNGSYSAATTSGLSGIYTVTTGQGTYYAAEISKKFLAANLPSGRTENKISVAVTSDIDNTNNWANIVGTYTYIVIDNTTQGSSKDWGTVQVYNDKTFYAKEYSSSNVSPENLQANTVPDGEYSGTFSLQNDHKERLSVAFDGGSPNGKNWTGFVYATSTEGAIVLDRGTGEGFILAIKNVAGTSLSSVSGNYKYITFDGGTGKPVAGNVTINQSTGTYSEVENGGSLSTGSITGLSQITSLGNMFYGYNDANAKVYAAMCGSMFFMVIFDGSGFVQYGVGGKM